MDLRRYHTGILAFFIIMFAVRHGNAADGDSLAYTQKRDWLRDSTAYPPEYESYFDAAQELADKGMYLDAHDLLVELFAGVLEEESPDTSMPPASRTGRTAPRKKMETQGLMIGDTIGKVISAEEKKKIAWRLRTTVSYDKYNDSYLTAADSDSLDSLYGVFDEIDHQPLNGNMRLSLDWTPGPEAIEKVSPFVYLSNTRVRLGASGNGAAARKYIEYNADVEGEKRLWEDYGDSSDMMKAHGRLEISSRPLGKAVSVFLPIEAKTEQYRHERSQYVSFWEIGGSPGLELQSRDYSRRIAVSMEGSYRKHDTFDNEDDEIGYGPALNADLWARALSGYAELSATWERHPNRLDPRRCLEVNGEAQVSVRAGSVIAFSLEASAFQRREWYESQQLFVDVSRSIGSLNLNDPAAWEFLATARYDTIASYNLFGFGGRIKPSVQFSFPFDMVLMAEIGYERNAYPEKTTIGSYPIYDTLYISESYRSYEPRIGMTLNREKIYATVSVSYRLDDIISDHYREDNAAIMPAMELTWRPAKRITIDVFGDYQYRMYHSGKTESSISASASLTIAF